jgi:hypothetical protein
MIHLIPLCVVDPAAKFGSGLARSLSRAKEPRDPTTISADGSAPVRVFAGWFARQQTVARHMPPLWLYPQFLSGYDAFVRVEKIRGQQRIEQGRKNWGKTRRKVLLLAKVNAHVAAKWPREFVSLANLDLSEAGSRQRK